MWHDKKSKINVIHGLDMWLCLALPYLADVTKVYTFNNRSASYLILCTKLYELDEQTQTLALNIPADMLNFFSVFHQSVLTSASNYMIILSSKSLLVYRFSKF